MDRLLYQQYLQEYIDEAARESDGSVRGIYEQLSQMQVKGLVVRHQDFLKVAKGLKKKTFFGKLGGRAPNLNRGRSRWSLTQLQA